MAEEINIPATLNKEEKYQALIPQIEALIHQEEDQIANLANISAALKEALDFFWVGFYLVKGEELVLGPFQGPVACTRIPKGKGVCGKSWEGNQVIVVEDVREFPGHIACNAAARSEIVVPVSSQSEVVMVLDVDSDRVGEFDQIDAKYLEVICGLISIDN